MPEEVLCIPMSMSYYFITSVSFTDLLTGLKHFEAPEKKITLFKVSIKKIPLQINITQQKFNKLVNTTLKTPWKKITRITFCRKQSSSSYLNRHSYYKCSLQGVSPPHTPSSPSYPEFPISPRAFETCSEALRCPGRYSFSNFIFLREN